MFAHMRTIAADHLPSVLSFLVLGLYLLCGCSPEKPGTIDIRRDHEAISRILDAAVLSDAPAREFRKALPAVRLYPSVDSAWTDGLAFYVQYKNGGIVSWTAPPLPTIQGQH
jgi:hypothetical protein